VLADLRQWDMHGIKPRVALLLLALFAGVAQDSGRPKFEVVSVMAVPIPPQPRVINPTCTGGNYRAPVRGVAASIRFAYNLQTYQLTGMPAWASKSDAAFDIEGKSAEKVGEPECRLMVQSLLAERFKLEIHRETKSIPVVSMTVAKGGPKIKPWTGSGEVAVLVNGTAGYGGENGWTMAQLADFAAVRFFQGSPIIDRTGLQGAFAIKLDFEVRPPAIPGDQFEDAVERQLGLKFESRKEPVEVVVVDHLERPVDN
jgi:uncharacterized protein (TIGR03435 family)